MVLNSVRLIGLVLLLGAPLFYLVVWYPLSPGQHALPPLFHQRMRRIVLVAGGAYLAAILLQTAGIAAAPPRTLLLNLFLVPVLMFSFARLPIEDPFKHYWLTAATVLLVLLVEATGSHAAADPGWLPYFAQLIHLLTAVIWGGGLACLALLCREQGIEDIDGWLARLDKHFYRLVLFMFIAVVSTGAMLAIVHVHSEAALNATPYGRTLIWKLVLVSIVTLVLFFHLLRSGRLFSRIGAVNIRHYRQWITFEMLIMFVLFAGSAAMRGHEPPDTATFLNPQTLTLTAAGQPLRVSLQPVAGSINRVRLEIFLPTALAGGDATTVFYRLSLPAAAIILEQQEALRVSADSYQGESTFPIPGEWQMDITVSSAAGETVELGSVLSVPPQPLVDDIATYLSPQAVSYSKANLITVTTGVLLVILYGWIVSRAGNGAVPRWAVLAGTGGVLLGLYLLFSVMLVKTYPTTYAGNPFPLTASVVARGQQAYTSACAECHGPTGKGDGPWALENRGLIPDLGSPHIDVHTDGEIYWWISRGIPELDMPAREQELSVEQRWELINYIRSLRHATTGP